MSAFRLAVSATLSEGVRIFCLSRPRLAPHVQYHGTEDIIIRRVVCAACFALGCMLTSGEAQQPAGPGQVVRPRKAEAPEGVKVVGCVLPEARPNAFRLVIAPAPQEGPAPKLPKGLKVGSSVELVARGETNLQPLANQKIEVTGKLSRENQRLEVVDAHPVGACDPAVPPQQ